MRVLIVNTTEETGGSAVAAKRLMEALNNNGIKAKMLVRDKETEDIKVVGLNQSFLQQWHSLWERWCILWNLHFSRRHLSDVDIANTGTDITQLREFTEADVIHLHWINRGFLSLSDIKKIVNSGKAVVWTMHDFWPAVAICHQPEGCNRYQTACMQCKYLYNGGSAHDLAHKVWKRKKVLLCDSSIYFVAGSRWLCEETKKSALLLGQKIGYIPNTIDTRTYHHIGKNKARQNINLPLDKDIVLITSHQNDNAENSIIESLQALGKAHPETVGKLCVAILGGGHEELSSSIPFTTIQLGYINSERKIVEIYNASDVLVFHRSACDMPNTILEAMACGTPCVGFNTGGIPEMIDHRKNGYIAETGNPDDMALGVWWVLNEADRNALGLDAVRKVGANYANNNIAMKYIEVYNTANAFKRYRL